MKVMFIVYHDIQTEARSQEILECTERLGEKVVFVSYSQPFKTDGIKTILTGQGRRKYFSFIISAIKSIKQEKPDIVILHDNYTAAILRWIYKHRKNIFIIYDSSELYIEGGFKSFKSLIARHMRYFEKKYLRYADVVISANIERAKIMKDYFKLKETPIVFDNIHRIDDNYNVDDLNLKYGHLFTQDKFNILYAGGIAKKRMIFELVEAVSNLGNDYRLIICGRADVNDKKELNKIISEKEIYNIHYIGFVSRSELRYLLNRAHISVSAFAQDTVNNINCASGKLFESLFEGTPILTSENPPLKRICNDTNVGVSNDNFVDGILELKNNYETYCGNIALYVKTINYEKRIEVLAEQLRKKIKIGK